MVLEPPVPVSPALAGAALLMARAVLPGWSGWPATVADTLALVGAGRSQSYQILRRLWQALPTLIGTPGRPATPPPTGGSAIVATLKAVRDHLLAHPGSACENASRCRYSDSFRRFVVQLVDPGQPGEGLTVEELADVAGVPLGTLKDWLRRHEGSAPQPARVTPPPVPETPFLDGVRCTHLQTVILLWASWKGTFQGFCQMLRTEYRLPYGPTFVGDFLECAGLRQRRPRQPVEAPWSSNTFRMMFPGAQWLGDGTSIAVHWKSQVFVFNVEAILDPASNALVGVAVTDAEDEEALRQAYQEGLVTAGDPPQALTLDNRPSNHSPGAQKAVGDVILLRATPERGQAKAPLEGAFGLFQQSVPPAVVTGSTAREMARCVLDLIWTAWARGRNGRPRKKLKGLTPAQAYANAKPTAAEVEAALEWFRELLRRQEQARLTGEARRDPVRLELLATGLAELGIADQDRRIAVFLAGYGRDAIAQGLSTFRSKLEQATLPPGADYARYLGGIIRNLHIRDELERISIHLLEQRLRLRDITLSRLELAAEQIRSGTSADDLARVYVDRALDAAYLVDFRYWAQAAAAALAALSVAEKPARYTSLCRRIAATFSTDRDRRRALINSLAQAASAA